MGSRSGSIEVEHLLEDDGAPPAMEDEVVAALEESPRRLPSTYFYDQAGSELFERITALEEYYPTRTELSILEAHAREAFERTGAEEIVELGAGAARKTATLIAGGLAAGSLRRYAPVEVSEAYAKRAARRLADRFPELDVRAVVADFTQHLSEIPPRPRRMVAFLGSSIGNFEDPDAVRFLSATRSLIDEGGSLLIGMDLAKDPDVLHAAYNDAQGVTAAFNRNILSVINRHLDGDFDPSDFEHVAFYDPEAGRIEMHLEARRPVTVTLGDVGRSFSLSEGERIRTEVSNKYTRERAERILGDAGYRVDAWWTDPRDWFALVLARPSDSG